MKLDTVRKVIFWLFTVLYIIVAPVIAFHALGFVYDPAAKRFVKTGIISIVTEPKQAAVFVNGKRYHEKTPTAISSLRPGQYHVQITRDGYQNWESDLEVRKREVTRIERILLVRKDLEISRPLASKMESFLTADDEKYFFLILQDQDKVVVLAYDPKRRKSFPVVELKSKEGEKFQSIQLVFSPDNKRLLAEFQKRNGTDCVVSLISDEPQPVFLSDFIPEPILNPRFHPRDSEKIFYLKGDSIDLIDLQNKFKKAGIVHNVRSFEIINDKIYYFDLDKNLFSVDLEGKHKEDLLPHLGLKKLLFGSSGPAIGQVFMTEKNTMLWLSDNGRLVMNRLPYFVDEDVRSLQILAGPEKLLYWKSDELWLLDLEMAGKRGSFFEAGPQKVLIWRSKRPIVSSQFIRDGSHAIVATDRTLELVEIDPSGSRLSQNWTIAEHWARGQIIIQLDESSGKLYWLGCDSKSRNELCEANLLEPSPFPFSLKFKKPYHSPAQISLD